MDIDIDFTTLQFDSDYKPVKLNSGNEQKRLSYLPCFPSHVIGQEQIDSPQFLLVSVSRMCLPLLIV